MPSGRISVVLQAAADFDSSGPISGFLVDEWVETVPYPRETTGIAFRHDIPDSCAPQAILLAVPPVPGQAWTAAGLYRVLLETLDLARLRSVNPEALDSMPDPTPAESRPSDGYGEASHFLPATLFALNAANGAIMPDFGSLTK